MPGPGVIYFCEKHEIRLRRTISSRSLLLTNDEIARIYQRAFKAIVALSVKTLGSETILRDGAHCPVCAFEKFNLITEIIEVLLPSRH